MNKPALLPILRILLLVHAPSTAHGQQLVTGDAIRVRPSQSTEPGRQLTEATVDRLTSDTLWYQSGGSVSAMSWDNVELQRSTFQNHGLRGLAIGAVAGGAIGGLAAYVIFEPRYSSGRPARVCLGGALDVFPSNGCDAVAPVLLNNRAGDTILGAFAGALIGGGLGYLVGRTLGHWEAVELDRLTVGSGALSLSFRIQR